MTSYLINGIALNDPSRGWTVRNTSDSLAPITQASTALALDSYDGDYSDAVGYFDSRTINLTLISPQANLDELIGLCSKTTKVLTRDDLLGSAPVKLLSIGKPVFEGYHDDGDLLYSIVVSLKINSVWFLGDTETQTLSIGTSNGADISMFLGLVGRIYNSLVKVGSSGTMINPKVIDRESGSFFQVLISLSNQWLIFDTEHARAYITTDSSSWTGTPVPDPTKIHYTAHGAPFMLTTDGIAAALRVESTGSGTKTISVRGRNAYA